MEVTCVCCLGRGKMWGSVVPCRFCRGRGSYHLYGDKTAIKRNKLSAPVRWLLRHHSFTHYAKILDLGCGKLDDMNGLRQENYNVRGFDPAHWPDSTSMEMRFSVVLCTYVLNVIPEYQDQIVLDIIRDSLEPGGSAFITVRRDLPSAGKKGRGAGVWQRYVQLPLESMVENRNFAIYRMDKEPEQCQLQK